MSAPTSVERYVALLKAESNIRRALLDLSEIGYNTARISDVLRDIASLMAEVLNRAIPAAPKPCSPIRNLQCCCCGALMRGRQWWNRDAGYGMCITCIRFVRSRGMSEEEIQSNYGLEGIHWGVIEERTQL